MELLVFLHAQMVITEMMMQYVNHAHLIVRHVPEQLNTTVLNVKPVSIPNTTMPMNVKQLVTLDIMPMLKQRVVNHVMIPVIVVKQLVHNHVPVVMEIEDYTTKNVSSHAQTIITIKITFVLNVIPLVQLVMEVPDSTVLLVTKPLIYKMENV